MESYIALLRAVNVGGTGKLTMADLKATCIACGFVAPKTYLATGNVIFQSDEGLQTIQDKLEAALEDYAGKPVGVLMRTGAELVDITARNPFADARPNQVVVFFCEDVQSEDVLASFSNRADEEIALSGYEIFVHYPSGQGKSKLRFPAARHATGRNMNTVNKLAEMCAAL